MKNDLTPASMFSTTTRSFAYSFRIFFSSTPSSFFFCFFGGMMAVPLLISSSIPKKPKSMWSRLPPMSYCPNSWRNTVMSAVLPFHQRPAYNIWPSNVATTSTFTVWAFFFQNTRIFENQHPVDAGWASPCSPPPGPPPLQMPCQGLPASQRGQTWKCPARPGPPGAGPWCSPGSCSRFLHQCQSKGPCSQGSGRPCGSGGKRKVPRPGRSTPGRARRCRGSSVLGGNVSGNRTKVRQILLRSCRWRPLISFRYGGYSRWMARFSLLF
jgi:hypothetical protein